MRRIFTVLGNTNRVTMQEIPMFDPLIKEKEREIHNLAHSFGKDK